MRTVITAAALVVALIGAAGCAENVGVRDESDRYTTPGPAASANTPTGTQQATAPNGSTRYQDVDVPAQPASAEVRPGSDTQPSATTEERRAAPPGILASPGASPNRSMPSGNTIQPGGVPPLVPGSSALNPGNIPPTVPSGGNTAGVPGR